MPGIANKHILDSRRFGFILSPTNNDSGSALSRIKLGYHWICDNGAFTGKFIESRWLKFLEKMKPYQSSCVAVVAPDIVADAITTLAQYDSYYRMIRKLGYRVAFVAQDGQEKLELPHDFDVLFVGGSTAWKLSEQADGIIRQAQQRGKWIHVGRVNSLKRINHFKRLHADSCDGTHVVFKPDARLAQLKRWIDNQLVFDL